MNFNRFVLSAQSSLIDACVKVQNNNCRAVVVEENGILFGVLSEGDVIRAFIDGARNVSSIREYVNIAPFCFEPNTPDLGIKFMQRFMEGITLVPIADDGKKLIGVKTIYGEFYAD